MTSRAVEIYHAGCPKKCEHHLKGDNFAALNVLKKVKAHMEAQKIEIFRQMSGRAYATHSSEFSCFTLDIVLLGVVKFSMSTDLCFF